MVKGSAKTYFHFLLLSDSYNNTALGITSLYSAGITALENPCTINKKGKICMQTAIFSSICLIHHY